MEDVSETNTFTADVFLRPLLSPNKIIYTSGNEVTLEKQEMHESLAVTFVGCAVLHTILSKFCNWPLQEHFFVY